MTNDKIQRTKDNKGQRKKDRVQRTTKDKGQLIEEKDRGQRTTTKDLRPKT
jgi:hypothetical protein